MGVKIEIDGQEVWVHDENFERGYFHTYDGLKLSEEYSERKVHVFLPRDYEERAREGKKYPVLYSHDGQNVFFGNNEGGKGIRTAEVLNEVMNAIGEKYIQPLIIAVHPLDRDNEYTHEKMIEDAGGGLTQFTHYFCDYLIPFFEQNYAIMGGKHNCIWGCSHGGLAAFYMATRRPDCFGAALCMSSSFWVGMDSSADLPLLGFQHLRCSSLITEIKEVLGNEEIRPRIYIDWGLHRLGFHNFLTEFFACKRGREMAEILRFDYRFLEFSYPPHRYDFSQHIRSFDDSEKLLLSENNDHPGDGDGDDDNNINNLNDDNDNKEMNNDHENGNEERTKLKSSDSNNGNDDYNLILQQEKNEESSSRIVTNKSEDHEMLDRNDDNNNEINIESIILNETTNETNDSSTNNQNQVIVNKEDDFTNTHLTSNHLTREENIESNSESSNEVSKWNDNQLQNGIIGSQFNDNDNDNDNDKSNGNDNESTNYCTPLTASNEFDCDPKFSELMVVEDKLGGHDEDAWNYRLFGALVWLITGVNDRNL